MVTRRRAAPRRKRAQPEHHFHVQVADLLTALDGRGGRFFWTTFPAGERRSAMAGARWKRIGVKTGMPDIMIWTKGKCIGLELKAKGGQISAAQRLTHELLLEHRVTTFVVWDAPGVLDELKAFINDIMRDGG